MASSDDDVREEHLRAVEAEAQRYRTLLETAPDAIVIVNAEGTIELVNAQTETMFGYARAELLGQPLEILVPQRLRAIHVGHTKRYFAHPSTRPMGSSLALYGQRKDGREFPIEVSLSPQLVGTTTTVSASIRDISERKRLEAAARITDERLRSAVESIGDAFALFDAHDRLVLCNSAYAKIVHAADPAPLVGKKYVELLDSWIGDIAFANADERRDFRAVRLARRSAETTTFDVRLADGRKLRVLDRRTPEGGIVKTIWDLTDDERLAEELRTARTAAEAASAAKSDFLSSMSHELRTPLNAILGFAQLLERDKKEPLGERHKARVGQILRGGEHLLRLIDDILDLSRIEAGTVSVSIEPVGVGPVLEEVMRTLEPMASRQGIAISADPLPLELPMLEADATRFSQILMNFGSNAVKYNHSGGTVRFNVALVDGARVRITVVDSGLGIPREKQDVVFQPFQRAGQETGPIEGTGIGLTITKRLAELMGGTVGFTSTPGEGSSFWVELPIAAAVKRAVSMPAPALEQARADADTAARKLILYVEDNPANVAFMRDLVSTLELDLLTAPTAELGLELARVRHPALIVLDINLPGMSGIEALAALRTFPETRDVPVIALTAAASERDRRRGEQAGFHRYLTKPVNVAEFIATVESVLGDPR